MFFPFLGKSNWNNCFCQLIYFLIVFNKNIRNLWLLFIGNYITSWLDDSCFFFSYFFQGYEDGKFRINDPNSVEFSQQLWDWSVIEGAAKVLWSISLPSN